MNLKNENKNYFKYYIFLLCVVGLKGKKLLSFCISLLNKQIVYTRETNTAYYCVLEKMSLIPPGHFPGMQLK